MSCMTILFISKCKSADQTSRPHIKWAVCLVILHMITSIFLRSLCGYIWVNILTFSPRGKIINSDQITYLKVRHMGQSIRLISDINILISDIINNDKQGIIMTL